MIMLDVIMHYMPINIIKHNYILNKNVILVGIIILQVPFGYFIHMQCDSAASNKL